MTISHWQANGDQPRREVDVLVIGAGVVGCAAAYFAAQAGREVVITDLRDIALGASGRNAGFMITGLDTYYHHAIERYGAATVRELWALSKHTHAIWQDFAARGEVPLDRCGSLLLAESLAEAVDLELAAKALQRDGIDVIYHPTDPLERGYYAGLEQPWDCAVQPYALARAIFDASGATLIANNEVYGYEAADSGGVTVYSHRYVFHAQKVLLCTNAYSARLDPYFAGKVIPTRAQCLVTEPLDAPVMHTCGYSDYGYMYYRMTFDNRFLIGGGRKSFKMQENDTTDDHTTDEVQSTLDAYMRRHFPDVTAPVARRWAGIMGFSVDGLPLVGRLSPDIAFAVGFTGHGLAMGAGSAERAVDLLLHGTHPGALDAARLDQIR